MRKPRGDSRLKTLPREKQKEIIALIETNTYARAAELVLEQFRIDTSETALAGFYSWFFLSRQLQQVSEFSTEIKQTLRELPDLNLSEDKLSAAGQAIFETMAIKQQDKKLFLGLRAMRMAEKAETTKRDALAQRRREAEGRAHVKTAELALQERRVALLERKADQADRAKAVTGDAALTFAEKEKRLKQIFGLT